MLQSYKNFMNRTFRNAQRQHLISALKPFFPTQEASILDIGAADGEFAAMMQEQMPHLRFTGIEVMDRGKPQIPIVLYDGDIMPFEDNSFDYAMLINMLHHTGDPVKMLQEGLRVSRHGVIIKDHYANNWFDNLTLMAMEYANPNAKLLLQRPLNFYSGKEWDRFFSELNVVCDSKAERFVSYGRFWDILFGRNMHFIGKYHLQSS